MNELFWPGHRPASNGHYQVCEPPSALIRQAVIMAGGKGVVGFRDNCIWLDIGRPDDFALAQKMFEEDRDGSCDA